MRHPGRMNQGEREEFLLGQKLFEAGDDIAALGAFEALLETCPRYADVHYLVGLVHERQGRLDDATTSLERALSINPKYAECLVALASVYEQQGEFSQSRRMTDRLGDIRSGVGAVDPVTRGKLANLQAAMGDAYREAGELREAVDAYRKAVDRAPHFHDIRYKLGIALREVGLPSQAVGEFKRVLRANPRFAEASVQLALTYYTLGRVDQAVAEWTAVLESDPSRDDARMYLRMVEHESAQTRGEPDR